MKVAVVGGGPVGMVTALYLAKEGHLVDLYEKGTWPRDKACGQGIMPSGMQKLSELGINFSENELYPFNGIHYQDNDVVLSGLLPRKGYGVERRVLSQKLFIAVSKNKNISIFPETAVLDSYQHSDHVFIKTSKESVRYDYLFAADGLNSPIRKNSNNRVVRKGQWRLGAREHFNQSPWSDKVEVYWSEGAEAYVTPVSKDKIEVAFLWYEDLDLDKKNLKESLWTRFPCLRKKINFSESQKDFRGYGPFSSRARNVMVGRVFFVGDAYCFLDGITGEGLSLGFKGAELVAKNFERWSAVSNLFNIFKFNLIYWHYSLIVKLALSLSHWCSWRRLIFRVLKSTPGSFRFFLYLNDL